MAAPSPPTLGVLVVFVTRGLPVLLGAGLLRVAYNAHANPLSQEELDDLAERRDPGRKRRDRAERLARHRSEQQVQLEAEKAEKAAEALARRSRARRAALPDAAAAHAADGEGAEAG
jgi:hypothetical protein